MHGVHHVKIVYAQQARLVNNYKNTKLKMLKIFMFVPSINDD